MIAAPEGANNTHLEALSRLSTLLMDASFRSKIENASTKQQIIQAIQEKEGEMVTEEKQLYGKKKC